MQRRSIIVRVVALASGSALALFFWIGEQATGPVLRVTALDVGQGDAILIETPRGDDVLIDAGPDERVLERLAQHLSPSDKTLELVVLTHPDLDHVGGLPAVAEQYTIERVLETSVRGTSRADAQWVMRSEAQKSERLRARAGTVVNLGGVKIEVLWPQTEKDLDTKKRNNTSVVIRMTYGTTTYLFTGDISSDVEQRLVQSGALTDVDVLKVPHHGSITSSSEEFLDAVKPEIAVISVGRGNRYGHPHPVVVRRLEKSGVKVLRTDEVGDVELVSDGERVTFDWYGN